MLRIYCDTGAYRSELRQLEREGLVEVFQFKYENTNRHVKNAAPPSNPTIEQMNYTWAEMKSDPCLSQLTYADIGRTSEKFDEILGVLGRSNETDAQHIDSAFRAHCHVFLTNDKDDIGSKRAAILQITTMKVLHYIDDWTELLALLEQHRDKAAG